MTWLASNNVKLSLFHEKTKAPSTKSFGLEILQEVMQRKLGRRILKRFQTLWYIQSPRGSNQLHEPSIYGKIWSQCVEQAEHKLFDGFQANLGSLFFDKYTREFFLSLYSELFLESLETSTYVQLLDRLGIFFFLY